MAAGGTSLGRDDLCPSCGRAGLVLLRVQEDGTEEHWYLHNRRGDDACVTTVGATSPATLVKPEPVPPSSPLPDIIVDRPPLPNLMRALGLSGWSATNPRLHFVLRHAEKTAFDRSVDGWLQLGMGYFVDATRLRPEGGYRRVTQPSTWQRAAVGAPSSLVGRARP